MILGLRTSDNTTQAWLYQQPRRPAIATLQWESGRALSEQLLARLEKFLSEHSVRYQDLKGIVIYSGPGSFTSLRIGHATANALADSLGIPVIGSRGDSWLADGLSAVLKVEPGRPALPYYGAEAHITRPKS